MRLQLTRYSNMNSEKKENDEQLHLELDQIEDGRLKDAQPKNEQPKIGQSGDRQSGDWQPEGWQLQDDEQSYGEEAYSEKSNDEQSDEEQPKNEHTDDEHADDEHAEEIQQEDFRPGKEHVGHRLQRLMALPRRFLVVPLQKKVAAAQQLRADLQAADLKKLSVNTAGNLLNWLKSKQRFISLLFTVTILLQFFLGLVSHDVDGGLYAFNTQRLPKLSTCQEFQTAVGEYFDSGRTNGNCSLSPAGNLSARLDIASTATTSALTSFYSMKDGSKLLEKQLLELNYRLYALKESGSLPAFERSIAGNMNTIQNSLPCLRLYLDRLCSSEDLPSSACNGGRIGRFIHDWCLLTSDWPLSRLPLMRPGAKQQARIAVNDHRDGLLQSLDTVALAPAQLQNLEGHLRSCHQAVTRACEELPRETVAGNEESSNDWLASIFRPTLESIKQKNEDATKRALAHSIRDSIRKAAAALDSVDEDKLNWLEEQERFPSWMKEQRPEKMTCSDMRQYAHAVEGEPEHVEEILSKTEEQLSHWSYGCGSEGQ